MKPTQFTIKKSTKEQKFETSSFILLYLLALVGGGIWSIMEVMEYNFWPILALLTLMFLARTTPVIRRFSSPLRHFKTALGKVATDNNLRLYGRSRFEPTDEYYPAVFALGTRARIEYGAHGIIAKVPTDMYLLSYRSYFRRDVDRHEVVVFEYEFPTLLPHTILQRKNAKNSPVANSIERTFDDSQRVGLQNNLDEFFALYTHRRTVTDALTVWSPQLLESLRDLEDMVSVETIGRRLYIYLAPGYRTFSLTRVLEFNEKVVRSLLRTTKTNFLKLPNDSKYPFLRSRPSGGFVVVAGKYFHLSLVVLSISLLVHGLSAASRNTAISWTIFGLYAIFVIIFTLALTTARSAYTRRLDRRGY